VNKEHSAVLACVGAVIGAGFASGREVVTFFTQYGGHGWWLIVLASLLMTGLCALCMQASGTGGPDWIRLVHGGWAAQLCPLLLMTLTAGAMISASGHMVALAWSHPWAYELGVLGTLLASWQMAHGRLKMLNVLSGALTLMLLCVLMASLGRLPAETVVRTQSYNLTGLVAAAVRAAGYAAMNMTLAIGVVCQSAQHTASHRVTAGLFGWMIGMLLLISHCVYSRDPSSGGMVFPLLSLLKAYGRAGYAAGVTLLYLAIVTTLTSVLYALRSALESRIARRELRWLLVPGIPLAVSGVGFESIVDRLYAPAGLICLAAVFAPMALRLWKRTTFP